MIYSLPNGKVIHLTLEEYLDLTDEDIQYLMSINAGEYPRSNWQGSAISRRAKIPKEDDEEEEEIEDDRSIDFMADDEDDSTTGLFGSDNYYEEDFPDFPDNFSN